MTRPHAPHAPHATEEPALDALARLSASDQEVLRLVAWEELTHAQIADVLGISVNAVAIRLHRARQRFAATLPQTSDDGAKGSDRSRTHTEQWMRSASSTGNEAIQ